MLFEVKRGDQRLYWTEHAHLIPDKKTRKQMRAAGLRHFLDGKPLSETTERQLLP